MSPITTAVPILRRGVAREERVAPDLTVALSKLSVLATGKPLGEAGAGVEESERLTESVVLPPVVEDAKGMRRIWRALS